MSFRKQRPATGARPGTLVIPPDAPAPRIFVFDYTPGGVREGEIHKLEDLEPYLERDSVTWIDVQGFGDEPLLHRIAARFGIEPLALEDAINVPVRAKSLATREHQVVVARAPLVGADGRIAVPQVCLFLGRSHLLTFQERHFGFFEPVRQRVREQIGPIREHGPDYLAYALVDTLVDAYYPVAEALSSELESLQEAVLEDPRPEDLAALHRIRQQVAVLRRIGWPQREALSALVRDRTPFVTDAVRVFLRDTADHMAQIIELVDSLGEMAIGSADLYLSNLSHRTNEVMKVLTLMASIFIPLTFIAGIYGMNFEHMPELRSPLAYPLVLACMALVAGGMVLYFRRKRWLGSPRRR